MQLIHSRRRALASIAAAVALGFAGCGDDEEEGGGGGSAASEEQKAQKVAVLKARAGVKDLPAVREGRFLNLPYAMWTSGPLNIEAAEQAREALEGWGLVPRSAVEPRDGSDAAE